MLAVADVTIFWTTAPAPREYDSRNSYGPVRCINKLISPDRSGKPHVDEDAFKKAMTDALTKGLSHLGFSADVYLGKFDDSRYVEEQRTRHQEPAPDQVGPLLKELKDHLFAQNKDGVLSCITTAKEQGLKMQIWNSLNQDERNILSNLLGVSAS